MPRGVGKGRTNNPAGKPKGTKNQRTMETLRRQYEYSPQAFALNRALGDQMTRQFARTYGVSPYSSVVYVTLKLFGVMVF